MNQQEYFLCAKTKLTNFIQQICLSACHSPTLFTFSASRSYFRMHYFNNVFTTFLDLKCGNWGIKKPLGFHQKYFNLCSEEGLTGVEQHAVEDIGSADLKQTLKDPLW